MRNNKQDLLTQIRITMSILNYTDNDMIRLFGKDYKQISRLKCDEVNVIKGKLFRVYREGV